MTVQWSKQSIDQDVKYGKLLLRKLFKLKKLNILDELAPKLKTDDFKKNAEISLIEENYEKLIKN